MTFTSDLSALFGGVFKRVAIDKPNTLAEAHVNSTYCISEIATSDREMQAFLMTLGCFAGEAITLISKVSNTYVVVIKDARYSLDGDLAKAIKLDVKGYCNA